SCCVVPIILAFLGLGSLGAVSFLARYRLILLSVPFIFLGVAYYFTYRKKHEPSEACCPEKSLTKNNAGKIILWVVTGAVVGLTLFAYFESSSALQTAWECCPVR
ncbi:MAG: hypothetical protein Q6360_06905, partial [Candidatus Brocadiales bacterium]|nr:hypothetical protein [Candidatus Brocadiales bacterium]